MSLLACPDCDRHVRASETTCPFCGADVRITFAAARPRPIPAERMSRAAMMAFAAASLGAASCGGETTSTTSNQPLADAGPDGANYGVGGAPAYGAPPLTGGFVGTGGVKVSTGGQMAMPVYGAPFPATGGAPTNTGGVYGYGGAIYGAPPPLTGGVPNEGTGGVMGMPEYGAPFPPIGGASNAGGANSATGGDTGIPIYGAAPIPDIKPSKP